MKLKNRHKRILSLMIMSQALLTLFVLYWLRSQYLSEKERMQSDLTVLFMDTQDKMIDTILLKSFVNPVLGRKKIIRVDNAMPGCDSASGDSLMITIVGDKSDTIGLKSSGSITVSLESESGNQNTVRTVAGAGESDEILLRSIRLFITNVDSIADTGSPPAGRLMEIDTATFRELFNEKVRKAGMDVVFDWNAANPGAIQTNHKGAVILMTGSGTTLPEASVNRYQLYVIRQILPQMLFGLVLIIITALAFTLSYRSIREHIILNNMRNEFVGNITHELKTPVATLSVALESLNKYSMQHEPGLMNEYLSLASKETKRLDALVNRILDHSLLEQQEEVLERAPVNIITIINDVAELMRQHMPEGSLSIIHDGEEVSVMGDELFLKGIFINLVDNSIKYCDKKPEISIKAGRQEDYAVIEISDNGPGIPEEYHKKIFEKFFRLPTDNVHNVKGYGLGLSLACQVISLHSGTIEVQNLDPGCSFILKIPAI